MGGWIPRRYPYIGESTLGSVYWAVFEEYIKEKGYLDVEVTFISIPYIGRLIFVKCANAGVRIRIRFVKPGRDFEYTDIYSGDQFDLGFGDIYVFRY